ncbi:MFS transporter [Thaumasiovibrio subtropicus]|uniref:MFS transporter n=1 Tax=Thaumasiovibrio subtropicus TaxID=1891207 RepID=UPI000B363DB5|nr:MFS transporter [Thaumasiovibrio subtropicus]
MESSRLSAASPSVAIPVAALSLYAVASGFLMSLIPLMVAQAHWSNTLASWLASAFYAGLLIGALFIEPLVNKLGHRKAFMVSLLVFMFTVLPLMQQQSPVAWLAARLIAGIAVASIFVIVESWLLFGEPSQRAKRLAIYMAALYGGGALGQLGIGWVGIEGLLPFTVILIALASALLVLFLPLVEPAKQTHSHPLSLKRVFALNHAALMGCVVSGLLLGSVYGLLPLALKMREISLENIGTLMAAIVMGGMVVQPLISRLSAVIGRTLLMALCCVVGMAAVGAASSIANGWPLAVSLFALGMAAFALYPVAINLGCQALPEEEIVSATQIMLFCYSIGSVTGPLLADPFLGSEAGLMGYLFAIFAATTAYMLIAALKRKPELSMPE